MPNPKKWDVNPNAAFNAFVTSEDYGKTSLRRPAGNDKVKLVSAKSAAIYRFMFHNFTEWLVQERKPFSAVAEQDLVRFISQKRSSGEQNSLITQRYLRLLERCYNHLQIRPNPATAAMYLANANGYIARDKTTATLEQAEISTFINALPSFEPPGPNRAGRAPKAWKRRRDHAMQAVMLFGGLRVAEVIGLRLSEIDDPFDGKLEHERGALVLMIEPEGKHDTSHPHETILRSYGALALRTWLDERASINFRGDLVFPGDLEGKPVPRPTLYRQVKATFERAGLEVDRAGGRTLRNTFAVQELQYGGTRSEVANYLGLALERSVETYEVAKVKRMRAQ